MSEQHPSAPDPEPVSRLRMRIADMRYRHTREIVALESIARTRLHVIAAQNGTLENDVVFNALMTALTLMRQHEANLLVNAERDLLAAISREGPTEWHRIDGYDVSFDKRTDASRFIVVREVERELEATDTGFAPIPMRTREVVGSGLIDGELLGHGSAAKVVWDKVPTADVVHVSLKMLSLWEQMRKRLLDVRNQTKETTVP